MVFPYWDLGNHKMAICDFPSKNQPSSHLQFCLVNNLYNLTGILLEAQIFSGDSDV